MNLHQNCAASKAKIINNKLNNIPHTARSRGAKRSAALATIPFWTLDSALLKLKTSRNSRRAKAASSVLLSMLEHLLTCGASMHYSSHFLQKKFLFQPSEASQVLAMLQSLGGAPLLKPRGGNLGIAASEYIIQVDSSEMFVAASGSGLMGRVLLA